jgi:hypothetical protein
MTAINPIVEQMTLEDTFLALSCSECFQNQGLRLDAERFGIQAETSCPNCGGRFGKQLDSRRLQYLAQRYFVDGTTFNDLTPFGSAPILQFNEHQLTSPDLTEALGPDLQLFTKLLGVGFFYYGPRMWMLGSITPLEDLQNVATRKEVVDRIIGSYGAHTLEEGVVLYRVRKNPTQIVTALQMDSPPAEFLGKNRLDSPELPILYASTDLELCLHECRVNAEDALYMGTLHPTRPLRLLDLGRLLEEEGVSEFDSLDLTVHFLFRAGQHSYEICREIAKAAHRAGYDGLVYPSYFSEIRTGAPIMETAFGVSSRVFYSIPTLSGAARQEYIDRENARIAPNVAIFGRPILEGKLAVTSIESVYLENVRYLVRFGPTPDKINPYL